MINVKIQKIIAFIPVFNVFIMFLWIINCHKHNISSIKFLKSLFIPFIITVVFASIMIFLDRTIGSETLIYSIFNYLMLYLFPLLIAWSLIKYQIKLGLN